MELETNPITIAERGLIRSIDQSPILRIVSDSGQEIKDVEKPELDIEYVGAAPHQRTNLVVRVPKYMSQYKSMLVNLGARFNTVERVWRLPAYLCLAIAAEETFVPAWVRRKDGFKLEAEIGVSDGYLEWKQIALDKFDEITVPDAVKGAWEKLYPFQKDAVRWLVENPYEHPGTLLALSPGLGKTLVAMTAASILNLQRVLIVCPLSLLSVWRWEKAKWFGKGSGSRLPARFHSIHGELPPEEGWVVTNYNTVTSAKRNADFCEEQWDLIILDESVMVKNRKSQRFMNIKNLRQSADRIWMLSGSPITRHPSDLWSQFNLIEQRAFPSFWRFTRRWCAVEETQWGTQITGSAGRNLREDFQDILFVKNQEEVLPDLPDMLFEHINVDIRMEPRQHRAYVSMAKQYVAQLEEEPEAIVDATSRLAQLIRLQQIASNVINLSTSGEGKWVDSSAKANVLQDMIEGEAIEYPALIWTHWRPGAQALEARLQNAVSTVNGYKVGLVHGGISDEEERTELFRRYKGANNAFSDADIDLLILSLGVGKFGLSMQQSRTIVYMDKSWFADDWVQSLFRVRRIGLTHTPRVISLVCPGTIDEMVEDNLAGKAVDISHITNGNLAKMLKALNRQLETGVAS